MLYRCTISLSLKQCPWIWFHIINVLFRIPDRKVSHPCSRVHFNKPISNTCVGSTKCIPSLAIIPPAFHTSVIVWCILPYTYFKYGSKDHPIIGFWSCPITTKLYTWMKTQNILIVKVFLILRSPLTYSDTLNPYLCAMKFVISGRYVYYSSPTFISSINSSLKSSSIIKTRFSFSTEHRICYYEIGYHPILCRINCFNTVL